MGVAAVFGLVFLKLHIPGGMVIGAIIGTVLLNLVLGLAYMPVFCKVLAQACSGAFIACSVHKEELKGLKSYVKQAVWLIAGYALMFLIIGTVLYRFTSLDKLTSYMSVVPGGLSDVSVIAEDLGANMAVVIILQFIRLLVGLLIYPFLIVLLTKGEQQPVAEEHPPAQQTDKQAVALIKTFALALGCGVLGWISGIPAGTLLFSLVSVSIWNLLTGHAYMSLNLRRGTQALAGAYIGCSISRDDIMLLQDLDVLIVVIIITLYLICCLLLAFSLHKWGGMTLRMAMLSTTPAGAGDVSLLAMDMHVSASVVAAFQIIRLLVTASLFPQLLILLLKLNFPFIVK